MESDNLLKLLEQLDPGVVLFDDAFNVLFINQALLPLLSEREDQAVELAGRCLETFPDLYRKTWLSGMRAKLGLFNEEQEDEALAGDFLSCLQQTEADYTNTLRDLALDPLPDQPIFRHPTFTDWQHRWQTRRSRQKEPIQASCALMNTRNPAVIPRNHRVEEALAAAERGDISVLETLLGILSRPYELAPEHETYREPPPPSFLPYRTFCGT